MHSHKDVIVSGLLGFLLTGAIMAPPIISQSSARTERIAAYNAALGDDVARFDRDQVAKFATLLRNVERGDNASAE